MSRASRAAPQLIIMYDITPRTKASVFPCWQNSLRTARLNPASDDNIGFHGHDDDDDDDGYVYRNDGDGDCDCD